MHEIQPDAVQVCTADARMQGRRCRSQSPLGTNTSLEDKTFFPYKISLDVGTNVRLRFHTEIATSG